MAETLLQVKDLIKEYEGNRILDGVNLEIEQGQVVVVVGPSGCGKSTLLRCINALEPIQGGQVILEGKTVGKDNLEELRQKNRHGVPELRSLSTFECFRQYHDRTDQGAEKKKRRSTGGSKRIAQACRFGR